MTEPISKRKQLQPFGNTKAQEAALRREALRTMGRQEAFDKGYITVKDLDDEELRSGRCRDLHTGLIPTTKGTTALIPQERYDEMVAEHELRYKQKLREQLDNALQTMVDIMGDDTVEPKDRFEAAKYLFERSAGKTPNTVNVNITRAPWEDLLNAVSGIAPITRAEHRKLGAGIIDAEFEDIPDDQQGNAEDAVQREDVPYSSTTHAGDVVESVPQGRPTTKAEDLPYGTADTPQSGTPERENPNRIKPERPVSARTQPPLVTDDHPLSYAQQASNQVDLQARRKAARDKIQAAKKARKVAWHTGSSAIKDEITGTQVDENGQVSFEQGEK